MQLEGQVRKQQAVEQEDGLCDTEDGESVAETSDDEDYQASLPDLLSPSDTDDEDYDSDATQIEASSPRVRTVRGGRKPPKMGSPGSPASSASPCSNATQVMDLPSDSSPGSAKTAYSPLLAETVEGDDGDDAARLRKDVTPIKYPKVPAGDIIDVKGAQWHKHKRGKEVVNDQRWQPRFAPKFAVPVLGKDIGSVFFAQVPQNLIFLILRYTNLRLNGADVYTKTLTKGELYQFLGYMLALSLCSNKPIAEMWATSADDWDLLSTTSSSRPPRDVQEPLPRHPAQHPLVPPHQARERRRVVVRERARQRVQRDLRREDLRAGLAADHRRDDGGVAPWRGQCGKLNPKHCPWCSFVPRKPEPLGVELKTVADALSGLIIHMEVCKGKLNNGLLKWHSEYGHTTSTVLRCTEPWHGSQRVVVGDSWFAGLKTAKACLEYGMHFIGDVKTNHALYPKAAVRSTCPEERGAWVVYSTEVEVDEVFHPVMAIGHRRHGKVHSYISTCGVTLRGTLYCYVVHDEEVGRFEIERQNPKVSSPGGSLDPPH